MHCSADDLVPMLPVFIIPYLFWFAYVLGAIFYFGFHDPDEMTRLGISLSCGMTICLLICTLFPNGTDLRIPAVPGTGICSRLLSLIQCYQDQFCVLEAAAKDDPAWRHQFELVRQKMTTPLQKAGITLIDQTNVPVSYDLHEVIDRVDTDNPLLRFCVAEVFKPGFLFKNKVLRKAEISAYAPPADEESGFNPLKPDEEAAADIPDETESDVNDAGSDENLTDEQTDEIVLPDAQDVVDALTETEDDADSTEDEDAEETADETVLPDAPAAEDALTGAEDDADSTAEDDAEEAVTEEDDDEAVLPDAETVVDVLTENEADSAAEDAAEAAVTEMDTALPDESDAETVADALNESENEEAAPAAAEAEDALAEADAEEAVVDALNDAESTLNGEPEDAAGEVADAVETEEALANAESAGEVLPDAAADAGEVIDAETDEDGEDSDDPESAAENMADFVPGAEVLPDPEDVINEMADPENDDDPLGMDPTIPDSFGF